MIFFFFLFFLFPLSFSANLFSDQAVTQSWKIIQLGPIQQIIWINKTKLIVVSKESIGSVSNQGSIVWRQVHDIPFLSEKKKREEKEKEKEKNEKNENEYRIEWINEVIIVSGGNHVYGRRIDGALIWEMEGRLGSKDVMIVENEIVKVDVGSGEVEWKVNGSGNVLWVWRGKQEIVVLEKFKEQYLVLVINAADGQISKRIELELFGVMQKPIFQGSWILWKIGDWLHFYSLETLTSGSFEVCAGLLQSVAAIGYSDVVYVVVGHKFVRLVLNPAPKGRENITIEILEVIASGHLPFFMVAEHRGEFFYASVQITGTSLNLKLPNGTTSTVSLHGNANIAKVFFSISGKTKPVYRSLILLDDHSLVYFEDSVLRYIREESLASVIDAKFLPISKQVEFTSFPSYFERLTLHLSLISASVKSLFEGFIRETAAIFEKLNEKITNDPSLAKNLITKASGEQQFRQLLVVLTRVGKLFGLFSDNGAIQWSLLLPLSFSDRNLWSFSLFEIHETLFVVANHANFTSLLFTVSKDGALLNHQFLKFVLVDSLVLNNVLIGIDQLNQVHQLAGTLSDSPVAYYYFANKFQNSISGFKIDTNKFKLVPVWSYSFSETELIVEIAELKRDPINSAIRRSGAAYLRKYLAPGLIAVATSLTSKTGEVGLNIFLIDSISGRVLTKVFKKGFVAPVKMLLAENFLVIHAFSQKNARYEVAVIEFVLPQNPLSFWDAFHGIVPDIYSVWNASLPIILQQSYVFYSAVNTLGITSTNLGITNKQILFGLSSGKILALDRNWLDPTRVPQPREEDKEEGMIPYRADLPHLGTDMITHIHQIAKLRKIITQHAGSESSSLVFAFGLDLFFSRITPVGGFDVLNDDFNYPMLLLTVFSMLFVVIWIRVALKDKENTDLWK